MNQNVGSLDRVVRVVIALVLFSLFFVLEGNLRWLGLIGIIPLATAVIGWCPMYLPLGLSTCARKT